MFILPPNCIVPSATSLTMSPVFPSFLYLISHAPSAANETSDSDLAAIQTEASKRRQRSASAAPPVFCADSPCSDFHSSHGGVFSNSRSSGFANGLNSGSRSILGCQGFTSSLRFVVMLYSMLHSRLVD